MGNMYTLAIVFALVAAAVADHPAPYHAPAPAPYHAPAHPVAYDESPKPFAFEYGVADDYSGARFNAAETTDGKTLTGSYSVNLPDGRIQTVTYNADPYGLGGYVAEVTYTGEPKYPEYKPTYKAAPAPYHAPAPYPPAPAYKPAPYHA